MRKQYGKPPIQEAVCDFRFVPGVPWNMTMPGRLYTKFERDYPTQRPTVTLESTITQLPGSIEHTVSPVERIQFVRSDEAALVQVSPNQLVVNHLPPYPGWPVFKPMIRAALAIYRRTAMPSDVQRIGLRYLNRVDLSSPVVLSDYFDFYPHVGRMVPQDHVSFHVGIEIPFEGGKEMLRLQLMDAPERQSGVLGIILDLDYFTHHPDNIGFGGVAKWLEQAHQRVEDVFEGSIK